MTPSAVPPFHCLLVEDNRDHAELICISLKQESPDCTIDLAEDGEAALEYLQGRIATDECSENLPDMVILDLHMKRRNGFEVLKAIRGDKALCELTVFVLTSSGSEIDRLKAELCGANQFFTKPTDFGEFVCMIKHLQMFWIKSAHSTPSLRLTE